MENKRCCVCGVSKELCEYHKNKKAKDSLQSQCKKCAAEYKRNWNGVRPNLRAKHWEHWRVNNIIKRRAHHKFYKAVKSGRVERPISCALGNDHCSGAIDAHHSDYSKPLNIIGLCKIHHGAWHRVFITKGGGE